MVDIEILLTRDLCNRSFIAVDFFFSFFGILLDRSERKAKKGYKFLGRDCQRLNNIDNVSSLRNSMCFHVHYLLEY